MTTNTNLKQPSVLDPAAPHNNITVMASAGAGKTWLLVTRVIRLLLSDTTPASILAVTFTRKAAGEMRIRLNERLFALAQLEGSELDTELEYIGAEVNDHTRAQARQLYETIQRSERSLRFTTFHAFCQDVLRRFPLEAGIPPGFELLEESKLIAEEAWDAMWQDDASQHDALDTLIKHCGSEASLKGILNTFLDYRSDWWALTWQADNPVEDARQRLLAQLNITPDDDLEQHFLNETLCADFLDYSRMLGRHDKATQQKQANNIVDAIESYSQNSINQDPGRSIALLRDALFTKTDEPRRITKALLKSIGTADADSFETLHSHLCNALDDISDTINKQFTWTLSSAWYQAGQCLLNHFQRIKLDQRLLDFTDLEWHTFQLLGGQRGHSQWVQYKLDQRINHILIDEFQDTNPTQWHMIRPLLEEMAQQSSLRDHMQADQSAKLPVSQPRSVFLVGDRKQSIYRFRRADPQLFVAADQWLAQTMQGQRHPLDKSRRSSPAIIDFVNQLFQDGPLANHIADFNPHSTWREKLWGRVEVLPLVDKRNHDDKQNEPAGIGSDTLRNPLLTPRPNSENENFLAEGKVICAKINDLISQRIIMGDDASQPPVSYNDIMILVRKRAHVKHYEQALREANIPYLGAGGSALTDSLEIQDLIALLNTLVTPFNNLTLAQVLRSPLFDCSNDDLRWLAQLSAKSESSLWFNNLINHRDQLTDGSPLARAATMLPRWQQKTGELPAHDLLDLIFKEGNVPARFMAAFPTHLHSKIQGNLTQFIELALEIDSGRYPSLSYFLARITALRQHAERSLDAAPAPNKQGGVQIMTIHASKGLEAAVVFLADTGPQQSRSKGFHTLINWPSDAPQPDTFLLTGTSKQQDSWSRQQFQDMEHEEAREQANLLYVAITRAKQMLIVTGSQPKKPIKTNNWHQQITNQIIDWPAIIKHDNGSLSYETNQIAFNTDTESGPQTAGVTGVISPSLIDALSKPIYQARSEASTDDNNTQQADDDTLNRGIAIHKMLELLSHDTEYAKVDILAAAATEADIDRHDQQLLTWFNEATSTLKHPDFQKWFDPKYFISAHNEQAIHYMAGSQMISGIIDRLIINENSITILDYKTHQHANAKTIPTLSQHYQMQMQRYRDGIQKIWPQHQVHCVLLFSSCNISIEM